jgi:hypothetical protein
LQVCSIGYSVSCSVRCSLLDGFTLGSAGPGPTWAVSHPRFILPRVSLIKAGVFTLGGRPVPSGGPFCWRTDGDRKWCLYMRGMTRRAARAAARFRLRFLPP